MGFLYNLESHLNYNDLKIQSVVPVENDFVYETSRGQIEGYRKVTEYYAICNSSLENYLSPSDSIFICDMELRRILIFNLEFKKYVSPFYMFHFPRTRKNILVKFKKGCFYIDIL